MKNDVHSTEHRIEKYLSFFIYSLFIMILNKVNLHS
jgi:hypothetical protein